MLKKIAIICMILQLTSVSSMTAQEAPTAAQLAQAEVQRYVSVLGLSSAQQEEALTIFTTEQVSLEPIKKAERLAHEVLVTAVVGDDSSTLTQVSNALGELRGQAILAESVAKAQLFQILTTEQQTKFKAMLNSEGSGGMCQMIATPGTGMGPLPRR